MPSHNVRKKIIFSVLLFLCSTFSLSAASITFSVSPTDIKEGDIAIVEAHISTANEDINAIDGAIVFDPRFLDIQNISTADSVFTLWTRKPSESRKLGIVLFTGGSTAGIRGEGLLFKVAVKAKKVGLTPIVVANNTALYINDGKGTAVTPDVLPFVLAVAKNNSEVVSNGWNSLLESDRTQPGNLSVLLGKDDASFEGKYFITFNAEDNESGIRQYEIQEGSDSVITSDSPYVLTNQSLYEKVVITATDYAGNKTSVTFYPFVARITDSLFFTIIIVLILLVGGIKVVRWGLHKKNKNKRFA